MWLQLNEPAGAVVTVNTDNIAYLRESQNGTTIVFNGGGGDRPVSYFVRQGHDAILAQIAKYAKIEDLRGI